MKQTLQCCLLLQIGAFFMINLCLVVIATQFSETKKRETERMLMERKRFHSSSTLASNNEPGGCYDEIIKYIAHLWRRAKRKLRKQWRHAQGRRQRKVTPEKHISLRQRRRKKSLPQTLHLHHHHHHHHHHYHFPPGGPALVQASLEDDQPRCQASPQAPRASPETSDVDPVSTPRRPTQLTVPEGPDLTDLVGSDLTYSSSSANTGAVVAPATQPAPPSSANRANTAASNDPTVFRFNDVSSTSPPDKNSLYPEGRGECERLTHAHRSRNYSFADSIKCISVPRLTSKVGDASSELDIHVIMAYSKCGLTLSKRVFTLL